MTKFYLLLMFILSSCIVMAQKRGGIYHKETRYLKAFINTDTALVVINKQTRKQLLKINLKEYDAYLTLPGVHSEDKREGEPYMLSDINFDGYEDLLYPSYRGNVQALNDVYLFNPKKQTLEYNEDLSCIPCIYINKHTKTIEGRCFHLSALENWTAKYKWNKGKLLLIEKKGITPGKGEDYYEYLQKRINGKMIFIYKKKMG